VCALLWHPVFKDRLIVGDVEGCVFVLKDFLPDVRNKEKISSKNLADKSSKFKEDDGSTRASFIDDEVSCGIYISICRDLY